MKALAETTSETGLVFKDGIAEQLPFIAESAPAQWLTSSGISNADRNQVD